MTATCSTPSIKKGTKKWTIWGRTESYRDLPEKRKAGKHGDSRVFRLGQYPRKGSRIVLVKGDLALARMTWCHLW
ncbi:hypothetical protein Mal65_43330 [Crateriforma conspicua]|nr:hypothetical protein Mal65_43330 [Crateriforma conspicua]